MCKKAAAAKGTFAIGRGSAPYTVLW